MVADNLSRANLKFVISYEAETRKCYQKIDVRIKRKRLMKADAASSKRDQRRGLIVCKQCCKLFIRKTTMRIVQGKLSQEMLHLFKLKFQKYNH